MELTESAADLNERLRTLDRRIIEAMNGGEELAIVGSLAFERDALLSRLRAVAALPQIDPIRGGELS